MPRYKLRTLLILLAVLPPLLWFGWTKYEAWRVEQRAEQARQAERKRMRNDLRKASLLLLTGTRRPRQANTDTGLPDGPRIEVPRLAPVPYIFDPPADLPMDSPPTSPPPLRRPK